MISESKFPGEEKTKETAKLYKRREDQEEQVKYPFPRPRFGPNELRKGFI